jgi:hypothetical protein
MLSERQEAIWITALWAETLELWGLARQPAHRIPEAIVRERQRDYFRYRLKAAIVGLQEDSELLAEVLEGGFSDCDRGRENRQLATACN